ncbi:hypothetical protein [Victivallis sp. Marseille-Q1083]|uniref:hypothetical protein n=1 Tax=Victivallis sp. Marseille-Q1083 TaxID=2717288 RepID=UPI00158D4D71|nr:hypothetical protein [Victivallis sp. Marseille-Q1083]
MEGAQIVRELLSGLFRGQEECIRTRQLPLVCNPLQLARETIFQSERNSRNCGCRRAANSFDFIEKNEFHLDRIAGCDRDHRHPGQHTDDKINR